jgi:adenylate cyclase
MSTFSRPLSGAEIEAIGSVASARNREKGITGVLLCLNERFFQVLEGDEGEVDALYGIIQGDPRHTSIVCLTMESAIAERFFPDWSMRTINLNESADPLILPVRILLQPLAESHGIIQRYTQPTVLRILARGLNPLALAPRRVVRTVLFADLVGFSALAEQGTPEETVALVNRYLDLCARAVADHGGEVAKFMGDCAMAHFPEDGTDAALEASMAILDGLAETRRGAAADSPLAGLRCGIGLARGEVIEGNIGSAVKTDYTVMGDPVNSAQRIEALTRALPRDLLFSGEVRTAARRPWPFVSLGPRKVKGKSNLLEVHTLDLPLVLRG